MVIRLSQKETKLRKEPKAEVIDLRVRKPKPPKLRRWIALALILLTIGTVVGLAKTAHQIPTVTNDNNGKGPSRITISTNTTNPSGTGTGTTPSPPKTVTLVHGRAWSTTFLAQTIEFEGSTTAYVAINYDPNSVNYQEYSVYLPSGQSFGVQMWQNTVPSDTRPECTANNGILNPFVVSGQADQVQDFACV